MMYKLIQNACLYQVVLVSNGKVQFSSGFKQLCQQFIEENTLENI